MKQIYMDNAATAFPKAPGVGDAMKQYIDNIGCNVKRSVYSGALEAEEVVYETRELLCGLLGFDKPENIVFTLNITQSLNFLLKGLLKPGDHCIVSSMEHNAVMRPLAQLANTGVEFSRTENDISGALDVNNIFKYIRPNTKAVIMTHASNVCGTILPLYEIGKACKERGLYFIIDSAQSAGILDIDFEYLNADAIAFTGHKGLLGPQGIGGFAISDKLAKAIESLISGGTGSFSEYEQQPEYMPDKFEAGTINLPGIYGLNTALKYINKEGIAHIREKELELTEYFINEIMNIKGLSIAGLKGIPGRTATVSIDFPGEDNGEIAYLLSKDFGIMTRCGLHCAPSAHKTLKTFPHGTVRFSFSHFNTFEEIKHAINALNIISKGF